MNKITHCGSSPGYIGTTVSTGTRSLQFPLVHGHYSFHWCSITTVPIGVRILQLPLMHVGVQQVVGLFGIRFAEELLIGHDHGRILMGEPDIEGVVDVVQFLAAKLCHFGTVVDRLSAAAGASAGTGHDFDEVICDFAGLDGVKQFAGIAQTVGDGDTQLDPGYGECRLSGQL